MGEYYIDGFTFDLDNSFFVTDDEDEDDDA